MHVAWRVTLGTACAGLALGLFIALGPNGSEGEAAGPPAVSTVAPTTTAESTTTIDAGAGPVELTITNEGIDEPLAISATAGEQIVFVVTAPMLGHLAVTGDDDAGGFVEAGTTTLKFKVKKPGTYPLELHTDSPEALQLGELVVTP